jgi:hypothetical protein
MVKDRTIRKISLFMSLDDHSICIDDEHDEYGETQLRDMSDVPIDRARLALSFLMMLRPHVDDDE